MNNKKNIFGKKKLNFKVLTVNFGHQGAFESGTMLTIEFEWMCVELHYRKSGVTEFTCACSAMWPLKLQFDTGNCPEGI